MSCCYRWALLAALLVTGVSAAPNSSPKTTARPREVEVRFADGSTVRMFLLQEQVEVVTKFGKLTVPAADIRRIEFGIHLAEGVAEKVDEAIKKLGSQEAPAREAASRDLVALGAQAYPALHAALGSGDPEVARRAEEAVTAIRAQVPAALLRLRVSDRIQTSEFPIVGRITSPVVKARSAYFGEKDLKVSDLLSLRALGGGGTTEVSVDAAKYGSAAGQWMDTDVDVEADMALTITAAGQVDLWQDGTGQYATGPNGYKGQAGGAVMMVGGRGMVMGGGGGGAHAGGALLGRIGDGGDVFLIGEKYKGKAAREGKLQLHIVPSPWGNASVGSYKVKITAGGP
jgi:hypothetical protein